MLKKILKYNMRHKIEKQGEMNPLLEIKYRKLILVYRSLQLKTFQNQ